MAYHTIRERGTGGFGVVYEVRDDAGRHFALKTLKPEAEAENPGADLGARFRREVKYQSAIDHPNVVKIFEHRLEDTPPWFIMKLAQCSLSDELGVRTNHPQPAILKFCAAQSIDIQDVPKKGLAGVAISLETALSSFNSNWFAILPK